MKRLLLALTLVGGSVLAPGLAVPASATTSGVCQSKAGVTVVVDFSAFSAGVQAVCVTNATSSTTGLQALQDAGFTLEGASPNGLAFICRINHEPGPPEDCVGTPPADAYWSYWYASNGGSWTYSSEGASTHKVKVGGFEGWAFHSAARDGNQSKPPALTPTRPTLRIGPAASTTTHRSSASSTSSTSKPTATKRSPTSTAAATSTSATATATPSTAGTSADSAGGALPGDPPAPGRSPWPFLGGAAGIAAILTGAYLMVLRRRGSSGF